MYKKGMRRAAALLAVCWLGLLFRAAAETPAEKLERLRAEGVEVKNGRVALAAFGLDADIDRALWGMPQA